MADGRVAKLGEKDKARLAMVDPVAEGGLGTMLALVRCIRIARRYGSAPTLEQVPFTRGAFP
jgi:hypothetical protein